jgi:hypothetical protein
LSIISWQLEQVTFVRCMSKRCRVVVVGVAGGKFWSAPGGGTGMGAQRIRSRTARPRRIGELASKDPWADRKPGSVIRPARCLPSRVTLRHSVAVPPPGTPYSVASGPFTIVQSAVNSVSSFPPSAFITSRTKRVFSSTMNVFSESNSG